jgi:hypothetical protein
VTQNGLVIEGLEKDSLFPGKVELEILPDIMAYFGKRTQMIECILH